MVKQLLRGDRYIQTTSDKIEPIIKQKTIFMKWASRDT